MYALRQEGDAKRPSVSDEFVAEVYVEAFRSGDPPTQAVAETLSIPYSTAAKRVARVRAKGLIPPASKGVNLQHPYRRCPTCGAMPSRQDVR